MSKYGQVATRAVELVRSGINKSALDAWQAAAIEVFEGREASQKKGCPKGTFLGLCEEGFVIGVPRGRYTRSKSNKTYAVAAVKRLRSEPHLARSRPLELWKLVMNGEDKEHNSQMDVVLALWFNKLIPNS